MRIVLQVAATGAAFAVLWIAFAHRIRVPIGGFTTESIVVPLAVLCTCAVGLALSYRASLREALRRAVDGEAIGGDERAVRITVSLLVGAGFLLRIAGTGDYGLNPDEAQLVWVAAARTPAEVWAYETMISPHPPALFFVFHYMLGLSWDLVWLRLPAVLGGTFSIWMSYRLGRELLGAPAGVAMAWLVTFSPPIFELSRLARNYAPGFAFIVLALFLLVRFSKTERWRYFAGYTVAATVAVSWHYVFIVVFIAMKLVLAIELLRRRARLSSWLSIGAMQLVFAGVMSWLYLNHIAVLPRGMAGMHERWYASMLLVEPSAPLRPLYAVWQLLAPGWAGAAFGILSVVGVVVLAAGRRWLPLSLCAVPLLVAIGFAWSGTIPLGGARQSVYLFPFLFLLAAVNVPEILTGYRATRSNLASLGRGMERLEPGARSSLAAAAWGSAAAGALGVIFAVGSLLDYNGESGSNPFSDRSYHGSELVRAYLQADVERAFGLLEEWAEPDDWVLLDFESVFALRLHLRVSPVISAAQLNPVRGDISMAARDGRSPVRRMHNGVQYHYSRKVLVHTTLASVLYDVRKLSRYYYVKKPPKVWLIRGAWSQSFTDRFGLERLQGRFDERADRESGGMLFGIDLDQLRLLAVAGE